MQSPHKCSYRFDSSGRGTDNNDSFAGHLGGTLSAQVNWIVHSKRRLPMTCVPLMIYFQAGTQPDRICPHWKVSSLLLPGNSETIKVLGSTRMKTETKENQAPNELLLALMGEVLTKYRKLSKLSQSDLAQLASVNRPYISDIERGLRNVSLLTLDSICTALGKTPAEILQEVY